RNAREAQHRAEEARLALRKAQEAKSEADLAKVDADNARQKAEERRVEAEQQREFTDHLLYASEMRLAQRAFENGEVGAANEILAQQLPKNDKADLRGIEWQYLDHGATKVITEATPVKAIAFSPDNHTLASGGNGFLNLRDIQSGKERRLPLT